MAAGLAEVFFVKLLDGFVLVGLADRVIQVVLIERFHTLLDDLGVAVVVGLAAAVDAAAGARHDLDGMVLGFAGFDLLEELAGIAEAGADRGFELDAADVDFGFLDAFEAADRRVVDLLHVLAGEDVGRGTERGFEHTAGRTEDGGRAGAFSERRIVFGILELVELDAGFVEHLGELTGGEDDIDVADAVAGELGTGGLVLLGEAGHDGDDDEVFRLDAGLLAVVALGDGAEHLLRGFGGGGHVGEFGELVFEELDPAGAAAGEDREILVLLHAFDQLGALFHDGEVGGEVGVEDLVRAEHLQGGDHLAGADGAGFHAEGLADGDTDGRSGLEDYGLGLVVECAPDVVLVVDLGEGADGARLDALAAEDALGIGELLEAGGSDDGVESAADAGEDADGLDVVAGVFAAAAHDAFVKVAADGGAALVQFVRGLLALVLQIVDAELFGDLLEFAVQVLRAGEAILRVVRKEQVEDGAARVDGAERVGVDDHAFHDGGAAGGRQVGALFDLDDANAAGAASVLDVEGIHLEMAESRDFDIEFFRGFEDGGTGLDSDGFVVDGKIDDAHSSVMLLSVRSWRWRGTCRR